jgi:hypothetical protein
MSQVEQDLKALLPTLFVSGFRVAQTIVLYTLLVSPFVFVLAALSYVASNCACFDFEFSLYLFGLIIWILAGILYFVVTSIPIRLHQSNQAHSTTCLAFIVCKYQVPYFIPCCDLQNMKMHVQ